MRVGFPVDFRGFQSTLPVWGGTRRLSFVAILQIYFNPPSPCGEGRVFLGGADKATQISIHPPRVGRDMPKPPKIFV